MDIKIINLRSLLSQNEKYIDERSKEYLSSITKSFSDLHFIIDKRTKTSHPIFLIETGGTEEEFASIHAEYEEPFYLLTSGENNSLAASMEILSFLEAKSLKGEIIHGSLKDVSQRISEIAKIEESLESLKNVNLGVIGKPSNWLIASNVDHQFIKNKIGVDLIDISTDELIGEINRHETGEIADLNAFMKLAKNGEVLTGALEIYGALKRIVGKYRLDGFTIRCFDLLNLFRNTSCLALAMLNQEGIVATCEGDVPALLTMFITKSLTQQSSFQANPSRIDTSANEMILAHCTVPLDMCHKYIFDTHFESGLGIGVKGELHQGIITLIKFSSSLERIILMKGTIIDNLSEARLCRTQIKVKFNEKLDIFLTHPIGNHEIIVYGDFTSIFSHFFSRINR
ncbi:MAG: hypothetical protein WC366_03180 [Bacilli bacterium]|jgi:L-fucose isomerase-like protein